MIQLDEQSGLMRKFAWAIVSRVKPEVTDRWRKRIGQMYMAVDIDEARKDRIGATAISTPGY
jgi:hypothetical protein